MLLWRDHHKTIPLGRLHIGTWYAMWYLYCVPGILWYYSVQYYSSVLYDTTLCNKDVEVLRKHSALPETINVLTYPSNPVITQNFKLLVLPAERLLRDSACPCQSSNCLIEGPGKKKNENEISKVCEGIFDTGRWKLSNFLHFFVPWSSLCSDATASATVRASPWKQDDSNNRVQSYRGAKINSIRWNKWDNYS